MASGIRPPALLFHLLMFFVPIFLVCEARLFTNHWAARITGGQDNADQIAEKYGFLNMGQVRNFKAWKKRISGKSRTFRAGAVNNDPWLLLVLH